MAAVVGYSVPGLRLPDEDPGSALTVSWAERLGIMVAPQTREGWLSEQRKYRQFTPEQKAEIVLAGLRGDRSVRDVCREYQIAETLYYQWRERLLEGGRTALANPREKTAEQAELDRLKRRVGQLERALGRKTYELEVAGELSRDWE
jgi:transposase